MAPQSNTYKKDCFRDAIVLLYKSQGQITERSVASKYSISKDNRKVDQRLLYINMAERLPMRPEIRDYRRPY